MFYDRRDTEEDLQGLKSIYDEIIVDKKIYLDELKTHEKYEFLNNKTFYEVLVFLLESPQAINLIEQFGLVTMIHVMLIITEPIFKKLLPLWNITESYLNKIPYSL